MTPVETLIFLSALTVGYFIVGTIWAIAMHRRIQWSTYPRAKWVVFVFNLNMWPECMAIWVGLQIYKFFSCDKICVDLKQLLEQQKIQNKLRRRKQGLEWRNNNTRTTNLSRSFEILRCSISFRIAWNDVNDGRWKTCIRYMYWPQSCKFEVSLIKKTEETYNSGRR